MKALLLLLVQALCVALYWQAFFGGLPPTTPPPPPPPPPPPQTAATTTSTSPLQSPPVDRVVLLLIDALRADFWLPPHHTAPTRMPQLSHAVSANLTMPFVALAHTPTATRPRLRAISTGTVPRFVEVLPLPPQAHKPQQQAQAGASLLHAWAAAGKRLVLRGDDTWLELYGDLIVDADATTSFYTTDTVEVDNNVTRHIAADLDPAMSTAASRAWDVLIMHYLGVDHVGHSLGPQAPRMAAKLAEMDAIISSVTAAIKAQDEVRGGSGQTLLLLLSDHGMTRTGNHGGGSPDEVTATAVFVLAGRRGWDSPQTVLQVDLVPTLAALTGVPTPPMSTGVALCSVLAAAGLDPAQVRQVERSNVDQLQRLLFARRSSSAARGDTNTSSTAADLQHELLSLHAPHNMPLLAVCIAALLGCAWAHRVVGAPGFAVAVLVPYPVLLSSSSFIENEHAYWFFAATTAAVLMAARAPSRARAGAGLGLAVTLRVLRRGNQVINFGRMNAPGSELEAPPAVADTSGLASVCEGMEAAGGVEAAAVAAVLAAAAVVAVGTLALRGPSRSLSVRAAAVVQGALVVVACGAVALYKVTEEEPQRQLAVWVYRCVAAAAALGCVMEAATARRLVAMRSCTALGVAALLLLLLKPCRAPTLLVACVACAAAVAAAGGGADSAPLLLFIISKCVFYALGNSHLVATVEFGGAYAGLEAFHMGWVGFGTGCILGAGALLTAVSVYVLEAMHGNTVAPQVWCASQAWTLAVYSILLVAMRFHLFVWTVFAPKYLYVVGEWVVVTLLGFALAVVSRVAAPGGGEVKKVA